MEWSVNFTLTSLCEYMAPLIVLVPEDAESPLQRPHFVVPLGVGIRSSLRDLQCSLGGRGVAKSRTAASWMPDNLLIQRITACLSYCHISYGKWLYGLLTGHGDALTS